MTGSKIKRGVRDLAFWWLEDEPPVNKELAQARANICMICPINESESGYQIVGMIARKVQAALGLKHKMQLTVNEEDKLGMCGACGCNLKLKVWTPMKILFRNGDKPDYIGDTHSTCWIRSESEASEAFKP